MKNEWWGFLGQDLLALQQCWHFGFLCYCFKWPSFHLCLLLFHMAETFPVINSLSSIQNFITQQLNRSLAYFLGLSDPQGNNKWQWIDNTPFSQNIRFWHPREPNLPEERCASIVFWHSLNWGWNDVFCDSKYNSICEMKKTYLWVAFYSFIPWKPFGMFTWP